MSSSRRTDDRPSLLATAIAMLCVAYALREDGDEAITILGFALVWLSVVGVEDGDPASRRVTSLGARSRERWLRMAR